MDYIREFDIRLEKEMYYAGEVLQGQVILDTMENFKLRAIRVVLRGKAHAEWKLMVSGDRRTVRDDQYFVDERATIWGKDKAEGTIPILPRGHHTFPFRFQLSESSLPCSFESKSGQIRYYIKVTIDIPYASPPQGMKYFTIIGPYIDCMEEHFLKPMVGHDKKATCCLCCKRGPVSLRSQLERTAYCCGESMKFKADINNQSLEDVCLKLKLVQYVEYFIDRGVLGVNKDCQRTVLEFKGDAVASGTQTKFDASRSLVVPVCPPTLVGVCRLIQIYYVLKVSLETEKSGEALNMHFPITIATVPFRIPNNPSPPQISYEVAADHIEGGNYVGPEFQLGQVYDGTMTEGAESVVLYRPVYVAVPHTLPSGSTTPNPKERFVINSACGAAAGFAGRRPHHVIAGRKSEPLQPPPNSEVAGDARMRREDKKSKVRCNTTAAEPQSTDDIEQIEQPKTKDEFKASDENREQEGKKEEAAAKDSTLVSDDKSKLSNKSKQYSISQPACGKKPGEAAELTSVLDELMQNDDVPQMTNELERNSREKKCSVPAVASQSDEKILFPDVTITVDCRVEEAKAVNGSAMPAVTDAK